MAKLYCIGGTTIDLVGRPYQKLNLYDSNPGQVKLSLGGVARNIAENAVKMDSEVYLMSLFGKDALGQFAYQQCQKLKLDLRFSRFVEDTDTASYLALLDDKGEMFLGLADMKILGQFEERDFEAVIKVMNEEDYCSIDTNLSEEILERLCAKIPAKIVMDPISSKKAHRAKNILKYLDVFKPNKMEAEILCGFVLDSEEQILNALTYFNQQGVKEIFISAGEAGIYAQVGEDKLHFSHASIPVMNTTGAGDAFLGVYLSQRLQNKSWIDACKMGICASYLTIQDQETVLELLNVQLLENCARSIEINIERK
jgi:pseudouridine kinase